MGFETGLSGLSAFSQALEAAGHNISNAGTTGYKSVTVSFAERLAQTAGAIRSNSVGTGTSVASINRNFSQGALGTTNNPLDLAVSGGGFFVVSRDGNDYYTRDGSFHMDADGYLVNSNGDKVKGLPVDSAGQIANGNLVPIHIQVADSVPVQTTEVKEEINLNAMEKVPAVAFSMTDGKSYNYSTSVTVYDSLGDAHTMTNFFRLDSVSTSGNSWSVFSALDGTQIGTAATGILTFDTMGKTTGTTKFSVSAALANGAVSPFTYSLDFAASSQFGISSAVNVLSQNGAAPSKLSGLEVSTSGSIIAKFSNGNRKLGDIMLAGFANVNGLLPIGDNLYSETIESGAALIGHPGAGELGELRSSTLEQSNVDLTAELVNLIVLQRDYQANAQTIKTQDQVLQTLVNLR